MAQLPAAPKLPPDPQPSKGELEAILAPQNIRYLDDYVARCLATALWRARRLEADPDAFQVASAAEVRVFPDGYLTLETYLRSQRWKDIRRRVLERNNYRCDCCGAWANGIYIRDYRPRVLRGDDLWPLVAICRRCEGDIHHDPVTGWTRGSSSEREAALGQIYGRTTSVPVGDQQDRRPLRYVGSTGGRWYHI